MPALRCSLTILAIMCFSARAAGAQSSRCLTPEAGLALQRVVATGALHGVLGPKLKLQKLNVTGQHVELAVSDERQREHGITLALPNATSGPADGQGRQFSYHLTPTADHPSEVANALLAAAALFDQAIPQTAIVSCAGDPLPPVEQKAAIQEAGSSRGVAFVSALAQIAVLVVATVVGLYVVRRALRARRP